MTDGVYIKNNDGSWDIRYEIIENVPRHLINDIMCTAMEGGCNYWISHVAIIDRGHNDIEYWHEALPNGGMLEVHLQDPWDDGRDKYVLNEEKFISGLVKFCAYHNKTIRSLLEDHDADDADQIVQFALFSEVIYG